MLSADVFAKNKWLSRVELEGDFPDYFHLYCTKGKELELLQIFGPETMAYFVDFCRAYNFEIYHDTLYVSQAEAASDPDDDTPMVADVQEFLKSQHQTLLRLKPKAIEEVVSPN